MSVAETQVAAGLECRDLTVRFGGLVAVRGLSLRIEPGAIHALIGPNGAGKSSAVNCLTGFVRASSGSATFAGVSILGLAPHRIAALGIGRTFQNINLFPGMTVLENVLVGGHRHHQVSLLDLVLRRPRAVAEEAAAAERARAALAFVGLAEWEDENATNLSYGHQRRVEIARALVLQPRLLLLDEPMAGMNTVEKDELAALVRRIRDRGTAILLIEHDMQVVNALSDRVAVLHHGKKIAEGTAAAVFADTAVQEAYLGRAA